PKEAEEDFNKASEEMDKMMEDIHIPEDWEISQEEKDEEKRQEKICEKRMKPVKIITSMAFKMVDKIDEKHWKSENIDLKDALDNITSNMALVSAKFYRAIHGLPESANDKPSSGFFYGYDAENTLFALKGFLWNFKSGCTELPVHLPEHGETCKKLVPMIQNLLSQIDEKYLPMVMELKKYDDV
ncbi:MAG: hypothetical protein ISR82_03240, partial [Candidatus Marinimicrobia bacterium]|nr:hypothetical protein [Candidatus Neomarinimicrobiota bacterium]MBL7030630.1 hypothetical protein [Candidatus Neomarinimicrobiota bacterium]